MVFNKLWNLGGSKMKKLQTKDIVKIEYQKRWFDIGLDYALISWTSTFNRMGKPNPYSRVQKIILGLVAELAFEQYLLEEKIRYEKTGRTKWYEEDRYDIGLKGYALDVKANFLDLKTPFILKSLPKIEEKKFGWFLGCQALVPLDQFNPGKNDRRQHNRDKIYIFPFIEGFFNECMGSECLVHTFWNYSWLKKAEYVGTPNLGYLKITYNGTLSTNTIKIYGTTAKNEACIETITLNKHRLETRNNFYQVFSIQWIGDCPNGTLTVTSPTLKVSEIVEPEDSFGLSKNAEDVYEPYCNNWQNLLLNKCALYLLGWLDEESMRIEGKVIPRFTKNIRQYSETKVDNWGCLISDLNPMSDLRSIK